MGQAASSSWGGGQIQDPSGDLAAWHELCPGSCKPGSFQTGLASALRGMGLRQRSPIHAAAKKGRAAALRPLIAALKAHAREACAAGDEGGAAAAAAGAADSEGELPAAAREIVRRVLDMRTRGGSTALMLACRRGHLEVVELLLQEGADPAAVDPDSRRTALHHAAIGGSARCAAALLTHRGGDAWRLVDARTAGGFAPLHFAALYGYAPVARVLIAAGARVMLPTSNQDGLGDLRTVVSGSTPLHLAALRGHLSVTTALLECYANQLHQQLILGGAAAAAAAGAGASRLPWEGDVYLDPRLALDSRGKTAWEIAEACGHGLQLGALLDPLVPIRRPLARAGANIPRSNITSLQALAARALNAHLTKWLDQFEAEQAFFGAAAGRAPQPPASAPRPVPAAARDVCRAACGNAGCGSSDGGGSTSSTSSSGSSSCSGEAGAAAVAGSGGFGGAGSWSEAGGVTVEGGCEDDDDDDCCGICLDLAPALRLAPCGHCMCAPCARGVLRVAKGGAPRCPFCRGAIGALSAAPPPPPPPPAGVAAASAP